MYVRGEHLPWESKNNESFESEWDGCRDCSTEQKRHLNRRALIRNKGRSSPLPNKTLNWQLVKRKKKKKSCSSTELQT